jgi:hypothetical protein
VTKHKQFTKKVIVAGLATVGLIAGGATAAHAATESPYVTVAWSFPAYPDVTAPQPFIASISGADLHAFDALAATAAWCGKPIQVDVYQRTDAHGISWESLKETGALLYSHDGGYLGYNAGVGTPYRVITSEEYPCATSTPTPEPTGSPSPSETPQPTVTPTPPVTPPTTPAQRPASSQPSAAPAPAGTSTRDLHLPVVSG